MSWYHRFVGAAAVTLLAAGGVSCADPEPTDDDTDETDVVETADTAAPETDDTDETDDDTEETGFVPQPGETAETDTDTDTDPPPCRTDWVRDCGGVCFSSTIIGNDFCDDGPAPQADFNCDAFSFDEGDCEVDTEPAGPCPFPGEVPDCNGACFAELLVGDDSCDDGTLGAADFACDAYAFDGGDCEVDTEPPPEDTDVDTSPCPSALDVRDCQGLCWFSGWLGDATCDDGSTQPFGNPDFDCPRLNFDNGDCVAVSARSAP